MIVEVAKRVVELLKLRHRRSRYGVGELLGPTWNIKMVKSVRALGSCENNLSLGHYIMEEFAVILVLESNTVTISK